MNACVKLSLMKNKINTFNPLSKWYFECCIRLLRKQQNSTNHIEWIEFLTERIQEMESLDF